MRFIKGPHLQRRTFLRGALGVAVGLPVLDAMLDDNGTLPGIGQAHAQASGLPRRYAVIFAGQALGADGTERNAVRIGNVRGTEENHFIVPGTTGVDGAFTPAAAAALSSSVTTPLRALQRRGVLGDVSMVSGLNIPFKRGTFDPAGADVPEGGAYREFHGGGCSPLISGTRSTEGSFIANGPSSDQLLQQALNTARGGAARSSLVLRAQPVFYLSGFDFSGREFISYSAGGRQGRIAAQSNHQIAWSSLFSSFVPPDDVAAAALQDFTKRKRLSVLDLVNAKRQKITARVGAADRRRLDVHFDQLRELELRIAAIPPPQTGTCRAVDDPGADTDIGGDNAGSGSGEIQENTGYSGEEERAQIMMDLIHMAFVCDLKETATLQLTTFQSHMNVTAIFPQIAAELDRPELICRADLHEVGHNGDGENKGQLQVSTMLYWHLRQYAYLLEKLKSTPEGAGTVLDNSSIVFMPEAGHGRQLNDDASEFATHSVEDMVLLVGGRAGGLQPGRHHHGNGAHPGTVILAAMKAAGFNGDRFGDVTGAFAGL
ncbi:MAG: DUF1552 domain-containing protein [Deltaproteobacteria bacterium]|nr:DUF1552 domain-containing protein [Deltaproteobacteria bacterium]